MPDLGYFGKLTGAALLGLVTLLLAAVAVFLLLPYIVPLFSVLMPFVQGVMLIIAAVLVIWAGLYVSAFIGVFIYYIFKPMKVEKKEKGYSISGAREAGRREKGDTKKE